MEQNFGNSLKLYIVSPIREPLRFKLQEKFLKMMQYYKGESYPENGSLSKLKAGYL